MRNFRKFMWRHCFDYMHQREMRKLLRRKVSTKLLTQQLRNW